MGREIAQCGGSVFNPRCLSTTHTKETGGEGGGRGDGKEENEEEEEAEEGGMFPCCLCAALRMEQSLFWPCLVSTGDTSR